MAGESVTFADSSNPESWQGLFRDLTTQFGSVAIKALEGKNEKSRDTQQAPMSNDAFQKWIPWIIGGTVVSILLIFLFRK